MVNIFRSVHGHWRSSIFFYLNCSSITGPIFPRKRHQRLSLLSPFVHKVASSPWPRQLIDPLWPIDTTRQHTTGSTLAQAIQYIPRNMHTVIALLCFVVFIHWLIFPYPSGLLHWHSGNRTIAPVPAKQPWWIWINTSFEFIMNDYITTTKQSTTKPCAYFLGYTVACCLPAPTHYLNQCCNRLMENIPWNSSETHFTKKCLRIYSVTFDGDYTSKINITPPRGQ